MTKLDIYSFGRKLITTNDLDPVYVVLDDAGLEPEYLRRWLLAFWCFYHSGTASWITDGDIGYWKRMEEAAGSKDYPRCHERRHFRGKNAANSVAYLKDRGLKDLFAPLEGGPYQLNQVLESVKEWVGFGPWIAFKVADMLERLGICEIEFDAGAMFLFDSPREGAEMLWNLEKRRPTYGEPPTPTEGIGKWAVNRILKELGDLDAPPRHDRPINSQEAETVLCKWKSYMGGHYEPGEDLLGLRAGLFKYPRCKVAQKLIQAAKRNNLW